MTEGKLYDGALHSEAHSSIYANRGTDFMKALVNASKSNGNIIPNNCNSTATVVISKKAHALLHPIRLRSNQASIRCYLL